MPYASGCPSGHQERHGRDGQVNLAWGSRKGLLGEGVQGQHVPESRQPPEPQPDPVDAQGRRASFSGAAARWVALPCLSTHMGAHGIFLCRKRPLCEPRPNHPPPRLGLGPGVGGTGRRPLPPRECDQTRPRGNHTGTQTGQDWLRGLRAVGTGSAALGPLGGVSVPHLGRQQPRRRLGSCEPLSLGQVGVTLGPGTPTCTLGHGAPLAHQQEPWPPQLLWRAGAAF